MQKIEQEIRQFLVENFLFGDDATALGGDVSFLDEGIIDSTGVLELVAFVESTYEIDIKDTELIPENLDTINSLVRFIQQKENVTK